MTKHLDNLTEIGHLLANGKIILCPTDTIWGLSCDALNPKAVSKIYEIKQRDKSKPFIILVSSLAMLNKYATRIHPRIENLIDMYKKPLTIIHQGSSAVPEYLLGQNGSIAIRLTHDPELKELIEEFGRPIVSTSANIQAAPAPNNFLDIDKVVKEQVDYIFYARREISNEVPPSQIISYNEEGELFFLR